MAESPNLMFISDPSNNPITDALGNAWRITQTKQVSANGVLDNDRATVIQVAYVNQMIWRQREDLLWQSKKHPGDPWLPGGGTSNSPIPDWSGHGVDEDERGMRQILTAIAAFRADFDANKGSGAGGGGITPAQVAQILASLATLQTDVTELSSSVSAASSVIVTGVSAIMAAIVDLKAAEVVAAGDIVTTLLEVLAAIKTNAPPPPTKIVLDLEHGTHKPQAIPPRPGP